VVDIFTDLFGQESDISTTNFPYIWYCVMSNVFGHCCLHECSFY